MIRRTVQEWGRIAYGEGDAEIPVWAADRLVGVARESSLGGREGTRILTHGRNDLRAGQVVGVLAAEGCVLEILPKIDGLSTEGVRRQLVHMLSVALGLDVAAGRLSSLDWQRHDLLEIVIRLYLEKLADTLRRGMPRQYVGREEDLPALRGRLDVIRQFTALAASPQILACRYEALSPDNALNRIIKATLMRLMSIARASETQRLLRELAFVYADVQDLPIAALRWDQVVLDRTNAQWSEILTLSKLLLQRRYQTTSAGSGSGFSLLFGMHALFEDYIARMFTRALRPEGVRVTSQGGRLYCLKEVDLGTWHFQTKPDLLVRRGSDTVMVVDTKWKRLARRADDPKRGVSQSDVYQMMAYGRIYQCSRLLLLYPHHGELDCEEGVVSRHLVAGSGEELIMATIDVSRRADIVSRLRDLASCVAGTLE
jgi:5-methylcytosine-specific restriction enzyme subunit McrC